MPVEASSEWSYFVHYLRNSLGAIETLSDIYLTHPPDQEHVQRLLENLKHMTDQSQTYIAAFAEFSEPARPIIKPLTMPAWLRDRITEHPVASAPGIQLKLSLPETPFVLNADPDLLVRAVNALLSNALDATPESGTLEVTLTADAEQAVLRVRNTGEQIAPRMLTELGKPFLTTKADRVGLGLCWAQRAAKAHRGGFGGGNVPAGVEFWIKIPLLTGESR